MFQFNRILRFPETDGGVGTLNADEAALVRTMRESKISGKELIERANRDVKREQGEKGGGTSAGDTVDDKVTKAVRQVSAEQRMEAETRRINERIEGRIDAAIEEFPSLKDDDEERELIVRRFGKLAKESGKDVRSMSDREFTAFIDDTAKKAVGERAKKRGLSPKSEKEEKIESRTEAMRKAGDGGAPGRTGGHEGPRGGSRRDDDGESRRERANRPGDERFQYGPGVKWPTDEECLAACQDEADQFLRKARKTG